MDGPLGEPQRLDIGPGPANPGEMESIQLSVSPDGRAAILTGVVPGGDASQVPPPTEDPLPVLAEGPPRLLGPIPWFTATWSPDGTTVAWIEDTSLVVAGADGRSRLPLDTPSSEPIGWLDAGTVMVPGRDGAVLVDVATMTARELPEADGGAHRAVDGGRVVDARLVDGAIRLRWYRADGTTDGPDVVLVDPGRVIRDPPACLDVQPLD